MSTAELIFEAEAIGVALDHEQADRLVAFESLVRERGAQLGVVSAGDIVRLRERHVLDCLRGATAVRGAEHDAYDLGSGGGFPGLVVAIACRWLAVTLVESRRGRAAFLELVVEHLQLPNARVFAGRIEDLSAPVDLCFARALGSLRRCWNLAAPLLRHPGRLVYFAGAGFERSELPADAAFVEILTGPALESSGPLVIIGRP